MLKLSPQSDVWTDTYHLPDLEEITEVEEHIEIGRSGFSLEEEDNNPLVRGSGPHLPAPPWEGPPMQRDPETGLYPTPPGTIIVFAPQMIHFIRVYSANGSFYTRLLRKWFILYAFDLQMMQPLPIESTKCPIAAHF